MEKTRFHFTISDDVKRYPFGLKEDGSFFYFKNVGLYTNVATFLGKLLKEGYVVTDLNGDPPGSTISIACGRSSTEISTSFLTMRICDLPQSLNSGWAGFYSRSPSVLHPGVNPRSMNLHNKSCTHVVTYKVELDKGSIVFLQDVYDNRGRVVHTVLMDADLDPITSRDSPGLLEEVREFVDQWNTEND